MLRILRVALRRARALRAESMAVGGAQASESRLGSGTAQEPDDPPLERVQLRLSGPTLLRASEQAAGLVGIGVRRDHADTLRLECEVDATHVIARDDGMDAMGVQHADDHLGFDPRTNDGDDGAHPLMVRPAAAARSGSHRLLLWAVGVELALLVAFAGLRPLADLFGAPWPSLLG